MWKKIKVLKNREKIFAPDYCKRPMKLDKKGFFLIKIDEEEGTINVGWCNYDYEVTHEFISKNAQDLYKCVLEKGLIDDPRHAAYLGYEVAKAEEALKNKKRYVQG